MFDFIRKHTRMTMILLFVLIVPSFVLFGIDGYTRNQEHSPVVAKVDGTTVTQTEWDAAHRVEVERLRASMPSLDARLLDSPEARYATLERLVRDRVLAAAATKAHLVTSDARLARDLQQNPTIATLRRPDGTLDMQQYRELVGRQGMTPEMFEARVRTDLSTRQVLESVGATGFATPAQADVTLNAFFERREVQVVRFNTAEYSARVNPSDAEIEAFYKDNAALFQAPEQASIEYLVLDADALRNSVTVNPDDLKTYYEQNVARLSGQEERRASHILINAPASAPAADRQKAKARAEELLAAVRKAPGTFAEVAKKNSQDTGSAPNGGDLDFFARGAMVKPFEDTAFALKKGDISDVVETDFGYHIIQLTDIKAPRQRSFEEMKAEIEADVKKQQAQRKFAESAEAFSNGVFEQSDSLKPVAERLKLQIRTANGVTRQPAPGVTGVLGNAKFLNALFAPDSIEKKRNTEAVETASSQLVSGRVTQYSPAHTRPLVEVREQVLARLRAQKGAELARKEGAEKLAAWKGNAAAASLPTAVTVSRVDIKGQPVKIVDAALRLDATQLPGWTGVDLGADGYAVVRVNKVVPRDAATAESAQQDRRQYTQWWSAAESLAYYDLLRERFKAQIVVARPVASLDAGGAATR
ncbi:SurA N-terminal domain-containing protein [Hydrogenophaga sp.]|uniref:SurA N-terminal domain-containing protein n=1 Tax=Hydrogenophaga sp. TaxID=1904254 RepID=UPI002ABB5FB4|nr:SurA N-terminal domain-containing protein [Hydrogenophaga sp.]MDZ4397771.1 SurA N-terminal domain-containing protein [Hydrogenophaga sp.]